jgi:hypothetical protein
MFKWPTVPAPQAPAHELADFVELQCWKNGRTSHTEVSRALIPLEENDYSDGVPEDDKAEEVVGSALQEIEHRRSVCGCRYPFALERGGVLRIDVSDECGIVYLYLLLATRLNMARDRIQADIDGTLLFENLSAETAREYFGTRAESFVFGTASGTDAFPNKVDDLCQRLKEGYGYDTLSGTGARHQDGKLDVVAWKPFRDDRAGKLIGFGQCKTGTHWKDTLTQLQPDGFCSLWMRLRPVLVPVRMFFVTEAIGRGAWRENATDAGLLFDRCRVIDFSGRVGKRVLEQVVAWTKAAAETAGLASSW